MMHDSKMQSKAFVEAAMNYFNEASAQAQAGDLNAAGILILKALDQERRAKGVGPQILHLIKPRN